MSDREPELLERGQELARLATVVEDARLGQGGMLVVEGEAGIGKTSLLKVARSQAIALGLLVLAARGSDLERGFAYGVVRQALERVTAGRSELFAGRASLAAPLLGAPGAGDGDPAVAESVLYGLYWLIDALVREAAMLLVVDDAQWADQESVAFLRFLALRLDGIPLAVIVAARPTPADDPLAALVADEAVEVVRPAALGLSGVAQLMARELGQTPDAPFANACHHVTGGNPFLIEHLARALHAERIAPESGHVARIAGLRADSVAATVLARIDGRARALARAVAILGDEVAVGLSAEAASLSLSDAESAADRLVAASVLADGRPLRFRHGLLRSAVLAGMTAGEQARAHAAAVELLRRRGATAERIAAQLILLEPGTLPYAAATLLLAARETSARGGHASAARLLRRALDERPDDHQRVSILMALGSAEIELGWPAAADQFIEAASIISDSDARFDAALAACEAAALDRSQGERAVALLDSCQRPSADLESRVLAMNARLSASFSDVARQHALAAEAESLGPLTGATDAQRRLLAWLARLRLERGEDAERVAELTESAVGQVVLGDIRWMLSMLIVLTQTDRPALADQLAQSAIERAQQRGGLALFVVGMYWRSRIAWLAGDLRAAEGFARLAIDAATDAATGSVEWSRNFGVSALMETLIDQGRIGETEAAWASTALGEVLPSDRPSTLFLHSRGRMRLALGDPNRALVDFQEARRRLGPSAETVNALHVRLRIAAALHALGRDVEARAESVAMLAIAQRFGAASAVGAALRVHGRLTDDAALLRESVAVLHSSPARLEEARARIDLGAHLRRHGARRDAREALRSGHDLATACGAGGLAEHARAELAASGIRLVARTPERRDELTPSEQRVATMAADGATNRDIAQALFLTIKTVEMHLSSTYRKLDIHSRRDLTKALAPHADDERA